MSDGTSVGGPLTDAQRESWATRGYFVLPGFADAATCAAMHERAVELCRKDAAGESIRHSLVDPERNPWADAREPEDRVSKVFILHDWDPVFGPFARDPRLVAVLGELLGPDIDCFLSQFIFKNPGAIGQPWHQDSLYFPFEPADQVGIWLAVTASHRDERAACRCCRVRMREPVHAHVARPAARREPRVHRDRRHGLLGCRAGADGRR